MVICLYCQYLILLFQCFALFYYQYHKTNNKKGHKIGYVERVAWNVIENNKSLECCNVQNNIMI